MAAAAITMIDDPTDPDSFGAGPYDGEGLAARANALIVDGVLQRTQGLTELIRVIEDGDRVVHGLGGAFVDLFEVSDTLNS